MGELTNRIRRVTEDLQAIQQELGEAARPGTAHVRREAVMNELVESNLVNDFKSAVDNMRYLLWSYIEASSGRSSDVAQALQSLRMQRVTDMLRVLQPTLEEQQAEKTPETQSFFDMIHKMASTALEQHSPPRSGV